MIQYKKYKQSSIDWIGEIPSHWEISKLKYSAEEGENNFQDGDWIESNVIVEEGDFRYITTGNIGEGKYKEQGRSFITQETFNKLECLEIFPDDLLISRLNPPIGRSCIVPNIGFRIVTSVDNVVLRTKKNIDKKFIMYVTNSEHYYEYTGLIARGATMSRISRTLLGSVEIPVPPKEEQTIIANFLDQKITQIDKLISNKEKLIELLKEERTAIISEVLSGQGKNWERKRLKYFGEAIIGLTYSPDDVCTDDKGLLVLRSSNIQEGLLSFNDNVYVTKKVQLKHLTVKGDILICARNGSAHLVGKCALIDEKNSGLTFGAFMTVFRSIHGAFLYYYFNSDLFRRNIGLFSTSTINQLTTETLNNLVVSIPRNTNEQIKVMQYLESETQRIDIMISKMNTEIELMNEYRTALISEVVTGKVKIA